MAPELSPLRRPINQTIPLKDDWEKYKPIIIDLYTKYGIPKTADEMRKRFGFYATVDMYKNHIHKTWKANTKNNNRDEMLAMTFIARMRAEKGLESLFQLRGRYVNNKEIQRYWKRKHTTVADAVNTISYIPYPKDLKVIEPMSLDKPVLAPIEFTQAEQIFWNVRKFSSRFEGFEDVRGIQRPEQYPTRYWEFQKTWQLLLTDNAPGATEFKVEDIDIDNVLIGRQEWAVVQLFCKLFYRFRNSPERLEELQAFLRVLLRDPRGANESLCATLRGLAECRTSQLTMTVERVMSVYLESLSNMLHPLHWMVKQMALDWAGATLDTIATRNILESIEQLTEGPRTMVANWQLLLGYWRLQDAPKITRYSLELIQDTDVPYNYREEFSPFLWAMALYSHMSRQKELTQACSAGTPKELAEQTIALITTCAYREYGAEHPLTKANVAHLADWGVPFTFQTLEHYDDNDIYREFCRLRDGWLQVAPLIQN